MNRNKITDTADMPDFNTTNCQPIPIPILRFEILESCLFQTRSCIDRDGKRIDTKHPFFL